MNSKSTLQKERQQRGEDFQIEIRRSWRLLPNCWRMRVADGKGGSRPADEIILLEDLNILAEHKRTQGDTFKFSMLRPNQVKGLIDFDQVVTRNYGLVFVSFLDERKGLDATYVFRLITALKHMDATDSLSISLKALQRGDIPCINLPLIDTEERTYDLKGVIECYKLL